VRDTPIGRKLREARRRGELAFIPYMIPGAPEERRFAQCMEVLARLAPTFFETALPVPDGWSGHTNETIQRFHRLSKWNDGRSLEWVGSFRPNLCVVYRPTALRVPFPQLLQGFAGRVDSVILEWDESVFWPYQKACEEQGIEFVHSVSPRQEPGDVHRILQAAGRDGFLYLLAADRTGGCLYPVDAIQKAVDRIKEERPDLFVLAGFGIRTPSQIRELRRVRGLDGVIVGTALLEACEQGVDRFEQLASRMIGACRREDQDL
jgi:tryptophan synthase alpha subunit